MARCDIVAVPATGGWNGAGPDVCAQAGEYTEVYNMNYTAAGTLKKRLGFRRYNSTAVQNSSGNAPVYFATLAAFTRYSGVTPTTKYLGVVSNFSNETGIYKDDQDGTWDALDSTWGTAGTREQTICIAGDYALFANGSDASQKWDQTTLSALDANAPNPSGFAYHLRRVFSAGAFTGGVETGYCLYSAAGSVTDWSGADAGNIGQLDPGDGDIVLGVSKTFGGKLYFFKGPHYGSVWELSGETPATFQIRRVLTGSPVAGHNAIVTTPHDIYWMDSKCNVHSLAAFRRTGDTCISRGISGVRSMTASLSGGSGLQAHGFWNPTEGVVGWTTAGGSSADFVIAGAAATSLVFNYVRQRFWLFRSEGFTAAAAAAMPVSSSGVVTYRTMLSDQTIGHTFFADADDSWGDRSTSGVATNVQAAAMTPKFYSFPGVDAAQEKQFFSAGMVGRVTSTGTSGTVTMTSYQDDSTYNATHTLALPAGSIRRDSFYADAPVEGVGRSLRLAFSHTGTEDFAIDGYYIRANAGHRAPQQGMV